MRPGFKQIVVLLTLAGCVTFENPYATDEGATTGGATGSTTTSSSVLTTGGVAGECDLWAQDCQAGAKCTPYDSMGVGVVDTTRCVVLSELPGQVGDPCVAEGGIVGQDNCDLGLLCWSLNESGGGVCIPLCMGSPSAPQCDEGLLCDISNGGLLPLCLTTCDPLSPGCLLGQVCIPSTNGLFVCDSDASGEAGAYGDPCQYINVCDPGLLCAAAPNVPGCSAPGCCTEYCDVTMPSEGQCSGAPEQLCLPYFDKDPPPGYESVGICSIKQ